MRCLAMLLSLIVVLATAPGASGHALEPAFLDLQQVAPENWRVFWRKPDVNGEPMEIDVSLPGQCGPADLPAPRFDGAAWIAGWNALCPGGIAGGEISIPGLSTQRTDVLVRIQPLDGGTETIRLTPQDPSHAIPETPTTRGVFTSYFQLGFEHILEGLDHLLFVFALLVLIRDGWRLVGAITAFTIAHSITLALAALGHLSIPGPPVEATIALSIIFLAVEILKRQQGELRLSERFPWVVSFLFGLLHGLGFAGALTEIGLPKGEIPAALLAFNLGVEAGQLVFVVAILLAGAAMARLWEPFRRFAPRAVPAAGYAIGSVATFWFVERVSGF